MAQKCPMHWSVHHISTGCVSPHRLSAAFVVSPYLSEFWLEESSSSLSAKKKWLRTLRHRTRFPHLFEREHEAAHSLQHRACKFCSQIGRGSWMLNEGRRTRKYEYRGRNGIYLVAFRKWNGTRAAVQAFPRPVSFLPAAGPLRDFLFATIGAVVAFLFAGIVARIWCLEERYVRATAAERGQPAMPEMGSNPGQKESVEWVNMVIHKIWKVYRRSLEGWLVQLLQPAIDNLGKPDYVKRVEIAEFNLDYEPLIVRNVQRRTSRRANDLQYHFGLRYAGGARCLLNLKLGTAGVETSIPVGVYDLDVDGELWLKLRLAPVKPYVGTLSLAFVQLPTIKLVLAPFRVVNLFSIPFLSNFLSKLLTVDLPRLLVLPRHITFDFLPQGQNAMESVEAMESSLESGAMDESIASGVLDLLKSGVTETMPRQAEPSEAFVGELSVTVCEARDLPIQGFSGWSNPYCILALGDQVIESKRNKETSHPAGHKDPVWNQDFQFLVEDPGRQKLTLWIRDSALTLNPNIGYCKISLTDLKDCVPRSQWINLKRDGPFGAKKVPGRVRLALTYKSFVNEDEDIGANEDDGFAPYIKVFRDSGVDSSGEEIERSLHEEISASLREEAVSDGQTGHATTEDASVDIVQKQKGDSVEVNSFPKASPLKSEESTHQSKSAGGPSSGPNGMAASHSKTHKQPTEQSPGGEGDTKWESNNGNGAVSNGRWNTDGASLDIMGQQNSHLPKGFGEGNGSAFRADPWESKGTVTRRARGRAGYTGGGPGFHETWEMEENKILDPERMEGVSHMPDRILERGHGLGTGGSARDNVSLSENGIAAELTAAIEPVPLNDAANTEGVSAAAADIENEEVQKMDWSVKVVLFCLATTIAYVLGCSLYITNPLHP